MLPLSNAMSRLVLESFVEPLDYPDVVDDRKQAGVKGEKLADFRWVFPIRGAESRTQILTRSGYSNQLTSWLSLTEAGVDRKMQSV